MHSVEPVPVRVLRLPNNPDLPLPAYATAGAAGMDVVAAEDVTIAPGARHAVATGLALAIPPGFEIQVRPRSGLALKHGITVPNTPGTIDSDYRGELKVILINHGQTSFDVQRGDRVAQLVLAPVTRAQWLEADELDATTRGAGGFGSTGGLSAL
jgi:dUTP pyrophosphatase